MAIFRAERMYGVNPQLVQVMLGAGQHADFTITCGLRTQAEQVALVAKGASQTMNSYHLTGDAVDVACMVKGAISWDFELYRSLNTVVQDYARRNKVRITWGGDWKTLRDGPHFQIERDPTVKV